MVPMSIWMIFNYGIAGIVIAGISFYVCKYLYDSNVIAELVESDTKRFLIIAVGILVVNLILETLGVGLYSPLTFMALIAGILIAGLTIYRHKQNEDTVKANA